MMYARGDATTFTYDGFDRPSQTTYPIGSTGTHTSESVTLYDTDDNMLTRTTRAGGVFNFAYDNLNRLMTKTPPASAPVVTYSYDLVGRIAGVSDTSSSIAAASTGASVSFATSYG